MQAKPPRRSARNDTKNFHFSALLQMPRGDFLAERFLDCATRHALRASRQHHRVAPLGMTPKTFISARSSRCCVDSGAGDFGGKGGIKIGFERREARFEGFAGCEFGG